MRSHALVNQDSASPEFRYCQETQHDASVVTRLPSTRDLAMQYRVSRGPVVTSFERLKSEGYLTSRVGAATFVSGDVRPRKSNVPLAATLPNYIGRAAAEYRIPKPFVGLRRFARGTISHSSLLSMAPWSVSPIVGEF
jgi:DNA-binding transcriptional MocR family regulator